MNETGNITAPKLYISIEHAVSANILSKKRTNAMKDVNIVVGMIYDGYFFPKSVQFK